MAFKDTAVATGTTNFDKTVQAIIERKLSEELRGSLVQLPPGAIVPASFKGKGSGGNGVFRFDRVEDLDAVPASHLLTEGVPPAGQTLDLGYEEFTAVQRGDFVRLSDLSDFESPHALANTAAEKIRRQMAAIIDARASQLWGAGANQLFAGSSNSATADVAAGDVMTSALIKRAVATLEGANVPRFGAGSNAGYVGLIHPNVKFDLTLDDDAGGWIDASRYGAPDQLFNGEIGKYAGVRFVVTTGTPVFGAAGTASIDVYQTTILGPSSMAFGDLATQEIIVERGGVSDPLHQQMTVGWKCFLDGMVVGEGSGNNQPEVRYVGIRSASSI